MYTTDHLGSPRIVTNGVTAQIEGKQAFGTYGEYLTGQAMGYKPLTGYTGHLQSESTGLIFMRGRFYSPAWHRFVNSDQGVDSNSWNQMSYVSGTPLMATDSTGMKMKLICTTYGYTQYSTWYENGGARIETDYWESTKCEWIDGESDNEGDEGGMSPTQKPYDPDCIQKLLTEYDQRTQELLSRQGRENNSQRLTLKQAIGHGVYGASRVGVGKETLRTSLVSSNVLGGLAKFLQFSPLWFGVSIAFNSLESVFIDGFMEDISRNNQHDAEFQTLRNEILQRAERDCGLKTK